MKGADLLVKCLENEGVEYVFGYPGEENLDLLESLRTSKIKFILTRHEQAAGFMAATYGRLTGKAGVCLTTLGPGATNLVTAAAYAYLGGMPMVMLTGQKPIRTERQAQYQIIDLVNIFTPITKMAKQVVFANHIAPIVHEAFQIAQEERPGSVLVEVPKDILIEESNNPPFITKRLRRPIAEIKAINAAVTMIEEAHTPLLLIGAGANRKLTSKSLQDFMEYTGIPFITTPMGKGVIDERSKKFLGTTAIIDHDFVHKMIEKSDLIINVGYDINEKPPFFMTREKQVLHVNFYAAKVNNEYFPQVEVIGDIANAIWQIKEKITLQKWDFTKIESIQKAQYNQLQTEIDNTSFPVIPQRFVSSVRKILPEDGILALDNGMYKLWFARYFKAYSANTVLLDNALATMGAGLASGIATKLVYPNRKVLVVTGDGGLLMNSQELETAVRLNIDLVILLLRDDGLGMIRWEQNMKKFPAFGLDFGNPDFVDLAKSYDVKGYRPKTVLQFEEILDHAINTSGVHLIDLEIDYRPNDQIFFKELIALTNKL